MCLVLRWFVGRIVCGFVGLLVCFCVFFGQGVCPCAWLSVCLDMYVCGCVFVFLINQLFDCVLAYSVDLLVGLSRCLSRCMSLYVGLSVLLLRLIVCLSVCWLVCLCLSDRMAVCAVACLFVRLRVLYVFACLCVFFVCQFD